MPLFPIGQTINHNYRNNFSENYFCCQVTITITRIIPLRIIYVIISWTMASLVKVLAKLQAAAQRAAAQRAAQIYFIFLRFSWPFFFHAAKWALSGPVLRDTTRLSQRYPPIARYGVSGVSTWPLRCDTPSPFSERFPIGEPAKWRCDTPLKRGISAILAWYPMKTRQMCAIPPSAILSRKGIASDMGGYLALGRSQSGGH